MEAGVTIVNQDLEPVQVHNPSLFPIEKEMDEGGIAVTTSIQSSHLSFPDPTLAVTMHIDLGQLVIILVEQPL